MLSKSKGNKLGMLVALLMLVAALLAACGDTPTATTTAATTAATTTAATTTTAAATSPAATTAVATTSRAATTAAATSPAGTTAATATTAAASTGAATLEGGYKVTSAVTLSASGASFPNPVYQQWIKDFAAVNPTVKITYNSVGSGAGRKDFFGGNTDFAGSDAYPSDKELSDYGKPVLAIPTTLGAVVLAYNLDGVSELKLSTETVGAIYTGKISKWNDPKIAAENSGVTLPDLAITLAVRQDDSGTTTVFSNWLAEVNKEFADLKIAGGKPAWEKAGVTVVQGPQNDGVAGLVKQTKGTLGYIESSYADANKITYAAIKNPGGKYVKATVESISKAAAGGSVPENLKLKVTQSTDPEAYPIASTTWILINKDFADKNKAEAVLKYLWWVTSDAAPIETGKKLGYAPLPAPVVSAVQAKLLSVTSGGQPVVKAAAGASAPATTAATSATTAATATTAAASTGAVVVPGGFKVNNDVTISASGASFPNPVYQQWIKDFAAVNPTVKITYNSVGSGAGRKDFFGGNTDFAGSDAYPSDKELSDYGKPVLAIPTTLGAVVLAYNLDGVSELKLSADTIGAIYTGKISKWNDPKIAAENSGVTLPDLAITLAVRQDDSGTTTVFSNWLAEVNKEFADLKIAGGKPAWEKAGVTVVQGPQNDGVAGLVKQTKGTLGYIESSYADANKITYAAIKNPGGKYVKATVESISKAAAGGSVPENLKLKVTQSTDPEAYPIASTTWVLINKDFADKNKAEAVLKYLWWVTSDAAPIETGKKLGYAPLPAPVVSAVQAKLLSVTAAGQPVLK